MIFYYIYFIILLGVSITGLLRFKRLSNSSRFLLLLLFITILSEIIATYLSKHSHSNVFVYHLFMPLEFATICLVYYVGELKILPLIAGLIFMTFSAVNSIYWQDFYSEFNSNAFIVFCVFILSLSLFYLYQLLQINTNNSFVDFPLFWISVAFSVFSLINLVVLGTHNSIAEKQSELSTALSNIRFFSNYLLYLLFIPAFLSKQATLKGD